MLRPFGLLLIIGGVLLGSAIIPLASDASTDAGPAPQLDSVVTTAAAMG